MANEHNSQAPGKPRRLFALALLFALLTAAGTFLFLRLEERRIRAELTPKPQQMTQVVVATRNLPAGATINSDTMAVRSIPTEYVSRDAIRPDSFNSVAGAVLTEPLGQGKMLLQELIDLNIPKDFSGTIREGMRAITIQVDEINSIAELVRPGNHIDLFSRLPESALPGGGNSAGGLMVIPVLEDVLVLATGKVGLRPNEDEFRRLSQEDRRRAYTTMTLEVTPKDAAIVSLAESRGTLIAVLKNSTDTTDPLFARLDMGDLFSHASQLRQAAEAKAHNRQVDGVHRNSKGQLVTRDGVVITDPNVSVNKNGLLVTKNGTVLNGRGLTVDSQGKIRDAKGKLVDTASLVAGSNDQLVDKHGTVLAGNGYRTTKGGFLVDKDGHILTPDGHLLQGVHLAPDGTVRTKDGQILNSSDLQIGKDGTVHLAGNTTSAPPPGGLVDASGRLVKATDLVTVDKDGTVRTKDGKILKGVHLDSSGHLVDANGKTLTAEDVALMARGEKRGPNGTILGSDGKPLKARDLVTIDKDGTVRTKDGKILKGVHLDKNGNLVDDSGHVLSAEDVALAAAGLRKPKLGETVTADGRVVTAPPPQPLAGVSASEQSGFANSFGADNAGQAVSDDGSAYEVEYIVGGDSDGVAKSFMVNVEATSTQ